MRKVAALLGIGALLYVTSALQRTPEEQAVSEEQHTVEFTAEPERMRSIREVSDYELGLPTRRLTGYDLSSEIKSCNGRGGDWTVRLPSSRTVKIGDGIMDVVGYLQVAQKEGKHLVLAEEVCAETDIYAIGEHCNGIDSYRKNFSNWLSDLEGEGLVEALRIGQRDFLTLGETYSEAKATHRCLR